MKELPYLTKTEHAIYRVLRDSGDLGLTSWEIIDSVGIKSENSFKVIISHMRRKGVPIRSPRHDNPKAVRKGVRQYYKLEMKR